MIGMQMGRIMYTVRLHPFFTTLFSIMLALFCWLFYVIYESGDIPDTTSSTQELVSFWMLMIFVFSFLIITIIYGIRRRIKVYVDCIENYPFIGRKRIYKWNEIGGVEIKRVKQGEILKLYDKKDKRICKIDPTYSHCKDFIETVQMHQGRIFHV